MLSLERRSLALIAASLALAAGSAGSAGAQSSTSAHDSVQRILAAKLAAFSAARDTAPARRAAAMADLTATINALVGTSLLAPFDLATPPVVTSPALMLPGGGAWGKPILSENFSSYTSTADLHADPRHIYDVEEQGGPWGNWKYITLDQTTGIGDIIPGESTQSMRFTYPDGTNATGVGADAARCSDFYEIKAFPLPTAPREVWLELYMKYSANFTTKAPASWNCHSNADAKTIFLVTGGDRFSFKNDYAGLGNRWDPTPPGEGDGDNNFVGNVLHDAQWHVVRLHARLATPGRTDGAYQGWIDGAKVFDMQNIATANQLAITGISLGNNINQRTDHTQTLNWGRVQLWVTNPGW